MFFYADKDLKVISLFSFFTYFIHRKYMSFSLLMFLMATLSQHEKFANDVNENLDMSQHVSVGVGVIEF